MKTEMIPAADLVGAIHDAFQSADSCHCEGDGKLSEAELTRLLAMRDIIPADLLNGPLSVTIEEISDRNYSSRSRVSVEKRIPHTVARQLYNKVRYLHQLRNWTYADLLALAYVGPQAIEQTERAMAAFGFLLKDGDPALLEPEPEPEPLSDGQAPFADLSGARDTCAEGLIALANEMIRDGSSLLKFVGRMGFDGTRVSGLLKKYIQTNKQTSHQKVIRVAGPWISMVDSERARQKPGRKQPAKRAPVTPATPAPTDDNVIHATFGA